MIVVRHGATAANITHVFQGHTDTGLTPKGVEQAALNASIISKENCNQIICSDLPRAIHTATIMGEVLNIPIQQDSRLREVYFGLWDGMTDGEIKMQYPDLWKERELNKWQFNGYDGESYEKAHQRAKEWLAANYQAKTIIVCHCSFGKILRGAYAELSAEEIMAMDFHHTDIYKLKDGVFYER